MAIDDNKHQQRVPINLTDREYLDACREAVRLDKKTGELIRFALRLYLYGHIGASKPEDVDCTGSD